MFTGKQPTDPLRNSNSSSMSIQGTSGKGKCTQLQLPTEQRTSTVSSASGANSAKLGHNSTSSLSECLRSLFEVKLDKLRDYIALTDHYKCPVKSFSTADIVGQEKGQGESPGLKKHMSECDLSMYSKYHLSKEINNEYITYSCSTLAICGDTIHSSQLPSPQTQSIRQINSFIFSDLDLIKSISKQVRNNCIQQRILEMIKCINLSTLQHNELEKIAKLSSNVIVKPIQLIRDRDEHFTTESGDILIHVVDYEDDKEKSRCVTKHDKEMFVLNWLQTVEACPLEPE